MISSQCELIRFCHSNCGLIILMDFTEEVWFVYVHWKDSMYNSFISVISVITLRNADDIAMYSALAMLRAISV
jgi:hypothetical protein